MRTLKDIDRKTLEKVLTLKQSELKKVVSKFLKTKYPEVIETEEYIIAEGDIPVALVAHLDTVFKEDGVKDIYYDSIKNVMFSPQGLGADDRAGVYSILSILLDGLRPHVIFTIDEEIGGTGAKALARIDKPFADLKYVIELDRRGIDDCVFYNCDNSEFIEYVESFGFKWNFGSYTDICDFCLPWGVAGVNLSIGYQNEHSFGEILFIGNMLKTIEKVKEMLSVSKELDKPFEYVYYNSYLKSYGIDFNNVEKCNKCGKYYTIDYLIPVLQGTKKHKYYCYNCISDTKIHWCYGCGEPFESDDTDEYLCPICQEEEFYGKRFTY